MPISSLIVQTQADQTDNVAMVIQKIPMADISRIVGEKIIVITETNHTSEDKQLWETLKEIKGVITLDLIYHNFEDMETVT